MHTTQKGFVIKGLGIGIVVFLGATVLLWAGMAGAAATDAQKCASKKHKEVGKYVSCLQKVESKAIKKGSAPDFSKCDEKVSKKWGKIDSKYGAECPTTGDGESLQIASELFADQVELLLGDAPSCLGNGVEAASHCWFLGLQGESCDQTCSAEGLVYDDATLFFAGSEASSARGCETVLSALGVPYHGEVTFIPASIGIGVGCSYCTTCEPRDYRVLDLAPTTSTAVIGNLRRACACQ